jgi:hypothetical protein
MQTTKKQKRVFAWSNLGKQRISYNFVIAYLYESVSPILIDNEHLHTFHTINSVLGDGTGTNY